MKEEPFTMLLLNRSNILVNVQTALSHLKAAWLSIRDQFIHYCPAFLVWSNFSTSFFHSFARERRRAKKVCWIAEFSACGSSRCSIFGETSKLLGWRTPCAFVPKVSVQRTYIKNRQSPLKSWTGSQFSVHARVIDFLHWSTSENFVKKPDLFNMFILSGETLTSPTSSPASSASSASSTSTSCMQKYQLHLHHLRIQRNVRIAKIWWSLYIDIFGYGGANADYVIESLKLVLEEKCFENVQLI